MSYRFPPRGARPVRDAIRIRSRAAGTVALAGLLAALILSACARREPTRLLPPDMLGSYVPGDVDSFPRVEYPGIGVTLNDRCMVRQSKLNPKMRPMYVNNRPIGFC